MGKTSVNAIQTKRDAKDILGSEQRFNNSEFDAVQR